MNSSNHVCTANTRIQHPASSIHAHSTHTRCDFRAVMQSRNRSVRVFKKKTRAKEKMRENGRSRKSGFIDNLISFFPKAFCVFYVCLFACYPWWSCHELYFVSRGKLQSSWLCWTCSKYVEACRIIKRTIFKIFFAGLPDAHLNVMYIYAFLLSIGL